MYTRNHKSLVEFLPWLFLKDTIEMGICYCTAKKEMVKKNIEAS